MGLRDRYTRCLPGGNSHGTTWRPCRRYAEKSRQSTVQTLLWPSNSVIRTKQASARSIRRSRYFCNKSRTGFNSAARSKPRIRSPRTINCKPGIGVPSRKANSNSTASQVWNGACSRNCSAPHGCAQSSASSAALSKPVSAIFLTQSLTRQPPDSRIVPGLQTRSHGSNQVFRGKPVAARRVAGVQVFLHQR